jgi:Global regulator protein family
MLLSRKVGQRIVLGPDIEITVVRIQKQSVKLGIDAPSGVAIKRAEGPPRQSPAILGAHLAGGYRTAAISPRSEPDTDEGSSE